MVFPRLWCIDPGSVELHCEQTASWIRAASFHKEHRCLGKWLLPGWKCLCLAWPLRGAGPRRVPVGAVGRGMFSPWSLLEFRSISCFEATWVKLCFPDREGGTRLIHRDPQLMFIQGCPCGVLTGSNAQCRGGDNSLDPGLLVRGFPKPVLSCKCR